MRAHELVVTAPFDPPPDRLPALRSALETLNSGRMADQEGWDGRVRALADLEAAVDGAAGEVRAAHALAAGLLERRAELRGRFEAYRAKAARLGLAELPELWSPAREAERLLWSRPCDLAAATRALNAYRRTLAARQAEGGS